MILRIFTTIFTILAGKTYNYDFLVLLSIRHYYLYFLNTKSQGKLIQDEPFWRTSYMKYMILEIVMISIHNLPNVNYIVFV